MTVSPLMRSALALLILTLAACQSYPLGMSEAEWNRLTPEQQLEARTRQAELDRARAEERAERLAVQRQREALLAAEERRRVELLYANARYGDILECVIEGGIADFHPGWRPYRPIPFTLARGEAKFVTFAGDERRNGQFWSRYSPDGHEVTICYRNGAHARDCVTVDATSQQYQLGIARSLTIDEVFQNARLACAYRPGPGMPQVVVHQHNVEVRRVVHHYHHSSRPPAARRIVEEHHWYVPPAAQGQARGHIPELRDPSPVPHRPSHPPVEPARRPADPETPAAPPEEAQPYTPTAAPSGRPRHPVPVANPRARAVAAPSSAVHETVDPGKGEVELRVRATAAPDARPGKDKAEPRGPAVAAPESAARNETPDAQPGKAEPGKGKGVGPAGHGCGRNPPSGQAKGHRERPDCRD